MNTSFTVLKKETDGSIALVNQNRTNYPELLECGYVPIKDGSKNELEDWLIEYFDANAIPIENRLYLVVN